MGVTTDTDKQAEELKNNIYKSIENCNIITDIDSWGYDDLSKDYLREISKIRKELYDIYLSLT